MNLYAVYDAVAGTCMNPFLMARDEEAIQAFDDACRLPGKINLHQDNFTLVKVCSFDTTNIKLGKHLSQVIASGSERHYPVQMLVRPNDD